MDYQRIVILLGLAVTSYLLILAWNEDYKQSPALIDAPVIELPGEQVSSGDANLVPLPVEDVEQDIVPTIEPEEELVQETSAGSAQATSNRLVKIATDVLEVTINTLGGDIVHGALPGYPASLDTPDIPFIILDSRNIYSAQSGLIGKNGTDNAEGRPQFHTDTNFFEMGEMSELTVNLRLPEENGVSITKQFIFKRSDYLIDVKYIVENKSGDDWQASIFTQIKRDSQEPFVDANAGMGLQPYIGGATFQENSPYTKLEFDDIEEAPYKHKVNGGYMAMVQHYFVSAWVPEDKEIYTYQARKLKDRDTYLFGFTGTTWRVASGQQDSKIIRFYLGPKDQYRLEEISPGLNLTVDYGFLWWLAQPLFNLLTFIHGFVNNWGVAIIFLTIVVKALLYPLSAASFRSMAKMRKLQPEMARLKDRYGDDRQQFSQAMMDLYKKEGANPLGGCLPMLLQMPVFIALYWSLMESVELRQAPFFLWIHDLSAMDPYFVLPILMGISMFVTQMLQPEPPDPVQAKVFKMMPIMFTFFFLWFPSGLVLYWFINNLLSILQQWYVTRQIEKTT